MTEKRMRQTRTVTWCVVRDKLDTMHFFRDRRAAEAFRTAKDELYKVTWRDLEGGVKSIVASLANLAVSEIETTKKRLPSMATWEQF